MLDLVEEEHQDLLKAADLMICYGYCAVFPSADFGDWALKRFTRMNDGLPLAGAVNHATLMTTTRSSERL
jgi:hypothetical protein